MSMRLDKYLCSCGLGTRSEVKKIIKSKRVQVEGVCVTACEHKVEADSNITLDGKKMDYNQYTYIMLNKPKGYISASRDDNKATVTDLLPVKYRNIGLFPVGRLDRDTVGLVILTNDGDFAHNTLSPKKHISKTYIAHIEGQLPEDAKESFKKGIELKDFTCKSAKLTVICSVGELTKCSVTISEGKYHQVKRMFFALGCNVVELQRISFGKIKLDDKLKEGEYRLLNDEELEFVNSVK